MGNSKIMRGVEGIAPKVIAAGVSIIILCTGISFAYHRMLSAIN